MSHAARILFVALLAAKELTAVERAKHAARQDDRAARLGAYEKLDRLGVRVPVPVSGCTMVEADCGGSVAVCLAHYSSGGNAYEDSGTYLRFGAPGEALATLEARVTNDVRSDPWEAKPAADWVLTRRYQGGLCGYGQAHRRWDCEAMLDAGAGDPDCTQQAIDAICESTVADYDEECSVVSVDLCRGRVGAVCRIDEPGKKRRFVTGEIVIVR